MAKKNFKDWSKEDLIKHVEKLEKRKKYGLVWDEERTREVFELQAQNSLPVLEEAPDYAVVTNPEQPTHILIEGDNYHALSVLNYTHQGNIDLIFIDPPYNIGNNENRDFKYNDSYVSREDSFRHSKWLSFMEKRLRLAKNLLKESGLIFITIDDTEFAQLKMLCDEIFTEDNFVMDIVWKSRHSVSNDAIISLNHNHVLFYARNKERLQSNKKFFRLPTQKEKFSNPDNDPNGSWTADPFDAPNIRKNLTYPIKNPNTGKNYMPPKGRCWRTTEDQYWKFLAEGKIVFGKKGKTGPQLKRYLKDAKNREITPISWWDDVGTTTDGSKELKRIFGEIVFPNPKPITLIKKIVDLSLRDNGIVLDFFAGSGSTAQAVMELNNEDGFSRQVILATNNENNICSRVCYPRIKKVISGYKYEGTEDFLLWESRLTISKLKDSREIYAEYEIAREKYSKEYDKLSGEVDNNSIRLWGQKIVRGKTNGLGGNLKYYRTSFVPAEPSDENKELLTHQSVEMLCLRESTFEFVTETDVWKIFKNNQRYTAILFDQLSIPDLKEELEKLDKQVSVYVFSLEDDNFANEFADMRDKIKVCSIPEAILRVYRRIYQ